MARASTGGRVPKAWSSAARSYAAVLAGLTCLCLLLLDVSGWAQPKFPALTGRVVDEAGLLSAADRQTLERQLAELEAKSTDQLVVVTLKSLQGYEIADYGYRLGRAWGIGQGARKDNGVLLIVVPDARKVRIEVGRGLEPTLTDATSRLIIENRILPAFRRGDFAAGIMAGARDIQDVLLGDVEGVKARAKGAKRPDNAKPVDWFGLLIFAMIAGAFVYQVARSSRQAQPMPSSQSRRRGARRPERRDDAVWWGGSGSSGGWSGGGGDSGGGSSGGGESKGGDKGGDKAGGDKAGTSSKGGEGGGQKASGGGDAGGAKAGQGGGQGQGAGQGGQQDAPGSTGPGMLASAASALGKAGRVTADAGANLAKGVGAVAAAKAASMRDSAMERIADTTGGKIAAAIKAQGGSSADTSIDVPDQQPSPTFGDNSLAGADSSADPESEVAAFRDGGRNDKSA